MLTCFMLQLDFIDVFYRNVVEWRIDYQILRTEKKKKVWKLVQLWYDSSVGY